MSDIVSFVARPHRVFGELGVIAVKGHPPLLLTRQEAGVLSRALHAVATGASAERTIFMSPIASDHEFEAAVEEAGMRLLADGAAAAMISWEETRALADRLRRFSED